VKRLTNGSGVQLALEAVGGEVTEKSMRCLAPFGCLVNYGNASNTPLRCHYPACAKIAPYGIRSVRERARTG
jgi:NADPH:quinone reductase-like Zn-dependent oxidoreductase